MVEISANRFHYYSGYCCAQLRICPSFKLGQDRSWGTTILTKQSIIRGQYSDWIYNSGSNPDVMMSGNGSCTFTLSTSLCDYLFLFVLMLLLFYFINFFYFHVLSSNRATKLIRGNKGGTQLSLWNNHPCALYTGRNFLLWSYFFFTLCFYCAFTCFSCFLKR